MTRKSIGIRSLFGSLCLVAVIVVVAATLSSSPTPAARPAPDCGPSYVWDCTMPDGSHKLVGGTRCDIAAFQRNTGARCVPSGL